MATINQPPLIFPKKWMSEKFSPIFPALKFYA